MKWVVHVVLISIFSGVSTSLYAQMPNTDERSTNSELSLSHIDADDLVLVIVSGHARWQPSQAGNELLRRSHHDQNALNTSAEVTNTLARALVESATPEPLRRRAPNLLYPNQCRIQPGLCAKTLGLIATTQQLRSHQIQSLLNATVGTWAEKNNNSKMFLDALALIAKSQPLPDEVVRELIDTSVKTNRRIDGPATMAKIVVQVIDSHGLSEFHSNQLTASMPSIQNKEVRDIYGSYFLNHTMQAETITLRRKRLKQWIGHENNSVRRYFLKRISEVKDDTDFRAVLYSLVREEQGQVEFCNYLAGGRFGQKPMTPEVMIQISRLAVFRNDSCGSKLLSKLNESLDTYLQRQEPIPPQLFDIISPFIIEYSPELPSETIGFIRAAIYTTERLASNSTLNSPLVDKLVTWFGHTGAGSKTLVRLSADAGITAEQIERLLTIVLQPQQQMDHRQFSGVEKILLAMHPQPEIYEYIGNLVMTSETESQRKPLLRWLAACFNNGKLEHAPVAQRSLLYYANEHRHAHRLKRLLHAHGDDEMLVHIAQLAANTKNGKLLQLLADSDLPESALETLKPMMKGPHASLANHLFINATKSGENSAQKAIQASFDIQSSVEFREANIRLLAREPVTPATKEALLQHLSGNVAKLRIAAFMALRKYELDRKFVLAATHDADERIEKEAWYQMDNRFQEKAPLLTKWRLSKRTFRQDRDAALLSVAGISGVVGVVATLCASIAMFMLGGSLLRRIVFAVAIFTVGFVATAIVFVVFIIPLLGSHGPSYVSNQVAVTWYVTLMVYWLMIFGFGKAVINTYRRHTQTAIA